MQRTFHANLAKSILAKTETSQNGEGLSEDTLWATREDVQALQETLNEAVAVMKDSKAGQSDYDNLEFQLRCKLEDFAVQSGKLEPNARASAIEGLTKMAASESRRGESIRL